MEEIIGIDDCYSDEEFQKGIESEVVEEVCNFIYESIGGSSSNGSEGEMVWKSIYGSVINEVSKEVDESIGNEEEDIKEFKGNIKVELWQEEEVEFNEEGIDESYKGDNYWEVKQSKWLQENV